jgi:outer membrane protein OmpA-like peptidoglycan-associated protein/tetratricopeptide (TPR) repeat protein
MRYFLLVFLLPLVMMANAQEDGKQKVQKYPNAKPRKKIKIAKKKLEEGSYYNAADYLEDVIKEKPDNIKVAHMLGELNMQLRDYKRAEKYYKMVLDKDPGKFPADQFYYAQALKMNGSYEDAKKAFQDYLKSKDDENENAGKLKQLARVEIEGCDTAAALMAAPTKIKVDKIEGLNRAITDLSPKPLKNNRIIFAQMKTDTAVNVSSSKSDWYASIYTADKVGNTYANKQMLPSPPNDPKANTGNAILSDDEKTMIYTRCVSDSPLVQVMKCKLYRTVKEGAEWGNPEELKSLNDKEGTTTHPAWGVDNTGAKILYYVTDKGGKSGMDIYYATVNADGTFGSGVKLGDEVNTVGNENTPFYDFKNKRLYFSTDGKPGLGGLDVFSLPGTPGAWTGPAQNAGVPINTSVDDFYFSVDDRAAKGYLVSNRAGSISTRGETSGDDIWAVTIQRDVVIKGIYVKRGDATNTPVPGVEVSLYRDNNKNFEFLGGANTSAGAFVFPVKRSTSYKLNGNKEGFWPSIENITISEEEERDTVPVIAYIDPIIRKKIRIPNIYFAFDKSNVITFYQTQIDSVYGVLMQNPAYMVEIQGHTDSKGTDEYNDKLSIRRAEEAKKYLVKKGIADNRITVKALGEKIPAAPNELGNGEDDPEGRARNRRVEFKIIPDNPQEAPEMEYYGEPVKEVKTGPGFTTKGKK